jgi:hypothetical protein
MSMLAVSLKNAARPAQLVLPLRHQLDVREIHAGSVPTEMVALHPLRDRTNKLLVEPTMQRPVDRVLRADTHLEHGVAIDERTPPHETPVLRSNATDQIGKTLRKWLTFPRHQGT